MNAGELLWSISVSTEAEKCQSKVSNAVEDHEQRIEQTTEIQADYRYGY